FKFESLVEKYKDAGGTITEQRIAELLLDSFPHQYNHAIFEINRNKITDLNEIRKHLRDGEQLAKKQKREDNYELDRIEQRISSFHAHKNLYKNHSRGRSHQREQNRHRAFDSRRNSNPSRNDRRSRTPS